VCVRVPASHIWIHVFPISLLATFRCVRKKNECFQNYMKSSHTHIYFKYTSEFITSLFTTRNYLTDFYSGREKRNRRESEFTKLRTLSARKKITDVTYVNNGNDHAF
jgi:hypothetical protein